jgi:hypothetical protein
MRCNVFTCVGCSKRIVAPRLRTQFRTERTMLALQALRERKVRKRLLMMYSKRIH